MTDLDRLYDLVVPPPVSWWPPAPGWYVVGGLVLALGAWGLWRARSRWHAAAYRRAALAELRALEMRTADAGEREAALQEVPVVVKRAALAGFPRAAVASLSGVEWLRFLDSTGHTDAFTRGGGQVLAELAYDPHVAAAMDDEARAELFGVVERWIGAHTGV